MCKFIFGPIIQLMFSEHIEDDVKNDTSHEQEQLQPKTVLSRNSLLKNFSKRISFEKAVEAETSQNTESINTASGYNEALKGKVD